MSSFAIPLHHEDLLERPVSSPEYGVEEESDLYKSGEDVLASRLESVQDALEEDALSICARAQFDLLFNLVNQLPLLPVDIRVSTVDTVCQAMTRLTVRWCRQEGSGGEGQTMVSVQERMAVKMLAFLLSMIVQVVEKQIEGVPGSDAGVGGKSKKAKKGGKKWKWCKTQVPMIAATMVAAIVDVNPTIYSRLWNTPVPDEDFLSLFSRSVFLMLENAAVVRGAKEACEDLYRVIHALVVSYNAGIGITTSIMHGMRNFEHLGQPLARLVSVVAGSDSARDGSEDSEEEQMDCGFHTGPAGGNVLDSVIQEIGRMSTAHMGRDPSGTKYTAAFVVALAEEAPVLMQSKMTMLLGHLDHDPYVMRNAVVGAVAAIVGGALRDAHDEQSVRTRKAYTALLLERIHDVNSYARSRALTVWLGLVASRSVPSAMLPELLNLAVGRLEDRSAQVRRAALQLVSCMLQNNVYAPELPLSVFTAKLEQAKGALEAAAAAVSEAEAASETQGGGPEDQEDAASGFALIEAQRQLEEAKNAEAFLSQAVMFIKHLERAVPLIEQLLGSKNASDVLASMELLVNARAFKVQGIDKALRKMLLLVWSKDESIQPRVLEYCAQLLVAPVTPGESAKKSHAMTARNLIEATRGMTLAEATSLEQLVGRMRANGTISPKVDQVLWSIFGREIPNITAEQAAAALQVLCMLASAQPELVAGHVDTILEHGLSGGAGASHTLWKWSCVALCKLHEMENNKMPLLSGSSTIMERLVTLIVAPYEGEGETVPVASSPGAWYPAAEQTIEAIYALAGHPEEVLAGVVKRLAEQAFGSGSGSAPSEALARLTFVLGHVALKEMVHIEEKHRVHKREAAAAGSKPAAVHDSDDDNDEEEFALEMGVHTAASEDAETEFLSAITESEIVGANLLGAFAPVLSHICMHLNEYENRRLRANAVLALTKYMVVSEAFCEAHLRLVFTLLNDGGGAVSSEIRGNIVVALGDLAVRFPNTVEPWTGHIYARLRDHDPLVRQQTLMVLTHLILNNMIKVKGQIAEMALSLVDPVKRIADLAHLFFFEMSRKANTIYNMLPDAISSLSRENADHPVAPADFCKIMTYLFGFIKKERQAEALVTKLCHRIRATKDPVHWKNFAYCLTLLRYSARGVRKLMEHHKCYQDKLFNDEILESFRKIEVNNRRFAKADLKKALSDYLAMLEALLNGETFGDDATITDAVVDTPAPATSKKSAKGGSKPKAKRNTRRKRKARVVDSWSDDGESDSAGGDAFAFDDTDSRRPLRSRN